MTKEVRLTITGVQSIMDQTDTAEIITTGKYYKKDNIHYIFYSEYTEEGFTWKNRLTIAPDYVELKKTGSGNSTLIFRERHVEKCKYQSPAGPMELVSDTKHISLETTESALKLTLQYSLYMNGLSMSDYHLTVKAEFL